MAKPRYKPVVEQGKTFAWRVDIPLPRENIGPVFGELFLRMQEFSRTQANGKIVPDRKRRKFDGSNEIFRFWFEYERDAILFKLWFHGG